MRPVSLALALVVIGTPALAQEVTVLRGSSAPPPQPASAPTTVIVQREIVYQPVYLDSPGYFWIAPHVSVSRHPIALPVPAASPVANGWPLFSAGRR